MAGNHGRLSVPTLHEEARVIQILKYGTLPHDAPKRFAIEQRTS